jgi:hypothetical protein
VTHALLRRFPNYAHVAVHVIYPCNEAARTALVGNKRLGVWRHWIDQSRALMVTHLSFCKKKDDWPAGAIANRV